MTIQFKKYDAKPSTLTCIRKDGSKTWVKMHQGFEAHDLAHFAVEKVLKFDDAFYGMLAKGFNIEDFEAPKNLRPQAVRPENLSNEALVTEHLVNLLMSIEQSQDSSYNILHGLQDILNENNLTFPEELNHESLYLIKKKFDQLLNDWKGTKNDEILELVF